MQQPATSPTTGPSKHRPEIDGLRAVAVVPVVLFHAGWGCTGGYVGVDVFFVISGYLITSLIWQDLSAGRFKIVEFWERRVRRILPALAVMVAACLIAGWWQLVPGDFAELGQSIVYQSLLLSNHFFWKGAGYFATEKSQPLLHTWSLAVEEQFYVLFPFVLVALKRFLPRLLVPTLLLGCGLSFALSVLGTAHHPKAAFYLLPSRAWELLLGALLAFAPGPARLPRALVECSSWAGFATIVYCVLRYDALTRFPGVAAALPCLGAALVIWSNSPVRTSLGKVLALRPWAFVGLISYPLYLWHWPLLVYSRYAVAHSVAQARTPVAIAISVALAILTWRIVETPFRKRRLFPNRIPLFVGAAGAVVALLVAGRGIQQAGGFRSRWGAEALRYIDGRDDTGFRIELSLEDVRNERFTEIGNKAKDRPVDLLLWGDSHAMAVEHVWDKLCSSEGLRCLAATHSATLPLLDFPVDWLSSLREEAIPYNRAVADFIVAKQIKKVVLVGAWSTYEWQPPSRFEDSLKKTLDELGRVGARVWIMEDVPEQAFDVPKGLGVAAERGLDLENLGVALSVYRAQNAYVNSVFAKRAGAAVVVVDPTPALSNRNGLSAIARNGHALYFDDHHLTTYGASELQPLLTAALRGQAQEPSSLQ